jgi:hypothetical protein
MPVFEYTATIGAGQATRWWTGGGGWYTHDQRPQMDAHAIATFPEGITYTGLHVPIWYGDFTNYIDSTDWLDHDLYVHEMSVRNDGAETAMYHFRVWVP